MENVSIDIDFDKASEEWRKNKKHIGNGLFVYTCRYQHQNGKICGKIVYKDVSNQKYQTLKIHKYAHKFCKKHLNSNNLYKYLN